MLLLIPYNTELYLKGQQTFKYTTNFMLPRNQHIYFIFILVINQHDAQNFCFTISLFHASTCFEHMCPSSGGQLYFTTSGTITLKQVSGLKLLKYSSINISK